MFNRRIALLLATGLALASDTLHFVSRPRPPSERKHKRRRFRGGWHKPHQNARECARRVGGQAWADYKAADRARRGLEPQE